MPSLRLQVDKGQRGQNLSPTSFTFSLEECSDGVYFSFLAIKTYLMVAALVIEVYTLHMLYFLCMCLAELRSKKHLNLRRTLCFPLFFPSFFLSVQKDHYGLNLHLQSKLGQFILLADRPWACLPLWSTERMSSLARRERKAIEYIFPHPFDKKACLFLFIDLKPKMGQYCK